MAKINDQLRLKSTICSVEYESQNFQVSTKGTAAIYGLQFPVGNMRTLFLTSFQVLPIRCKNEITGIKIEFEDNEINNLTMTPDSAKIFWTSPTDKLNVTIIELTPIAIKVLSCTNVVRLACASPSENEHILIYQCERCVQMIGIGKIDIINEEFIKYSFNMTESVIFGSPILNHSNKVIGISNGMWKLRESVTSNKHLAIRMDKIFQAYTEELNGLFKNHPENENWLEKLIQIPTNDFKLIGCGGYGKVYQATESNGSVVALKVAEGFGGLDTYASTGLALEKEFQIVTSLDIHPRIIQFFALVKDDKNARIIIVMEYLGGGSLADKIKTASSGHLQETHCIRYLVQIMEGVNFLHKNFVFHSDIKPANILFTTDDEIKLCDFGIAVTVFENTDSSSTASNAKGDCYYMSPERYFGEARSAENDLWSVGATFVTMISGHPLNHNVKFPQITYKISQYMIDIEGKPLTEYLCSLNKSDYRYQIISRTLCPKENRSNAEELLEICKRLTSFNKY